DGDHAFVDVVVLVLGRLDDVQVDATRIVGIGRADLDFSGRRHPGQVDDPQGEAGDDVAPCALGFDLDVVSLRPPQPNPADAAVAPADIFDSHALGRLGADSGHVVCGVAPYADKLYPSQDHDGLARDGADGPAGLLTILLVRRDQIDRP